MISILKVTFYSSLEYYFENEFDYNFAKSFAFQKWLSICLLEIQYQSDFHFYFANSISNWFKNILFQLTALGPLLYMLYLTCKCTSRSSSKRAAVGVHQHRINGNCPNNNQSLASHLMKHLDVQFYRTEIGICNLDNKSINDFDFQNRFRFKKKMKSKNEFRPVCRNIH